METRLGILWGRTIEYYDCQRVTSHLCSLVIKTSSHTLNTHRRTSYCVTENLISNQICTKKEKEKAKIKKKTVFRLHHKMTQTEYLTVLISLEHIPTIPKCDS